MEQLNHIFLSLVILKSFTYKVIISEFYIGTSINADLYVRKMLPFAKRQGKNLFGNSKWVFQQDGATSHTSNKAQNWCRKNFDEFLDKDHWPPNSPDLSPLDYFYWNEVQRNMKLTPFMNIDEFRQEIKNGCLSVIKESIKQAVRCKSSCY